MRLDLLLFEKGYCKSRNEAQQLIQSGNVEYNHKVVLKNAFEVSDDSLITVNLDSIRFVSRGGIKLEGALKEFQVTPEGKVCLDIGASTGGFTDCLLQYGADYVYALENGTGQLANKLLNNPKVFSIENTNARTMKKTDFEKKISFATMDVSFISQTLIHPALSCVLESDSIFISLIKPQFEVGKDHISKGGIVKDEKYRNMAIEKVIQSANLSGFDCLGTIKSPIEGGDGNIEYLAYFKKR